MKCNRGNALFLILIAVALFAALSYAVTNSGRGGGGIDREQSQIEASQILNYASGVRTAVQRMRVARGCSRTELNFENTAMVHPDFWGGSTNTNAPTDGSCDVFGPDGSYYDENIGAMITTDVSVEGVGTASTDLLLYITRADSTEAQALCTAINNLLKLDGTYASGTTRTLDWYYARGAGLTYNNAPGAGNRIGEDGGTAFAGNPAGCLQGSSSHDGDTRIIYYVLEGF